MKGNGRQQQYSEPEKNVAAVCDGTEMGSL